MSGFVIELAYAPSTNHSPFVKNLTSERASIYYTKKDVLKNRFFSNYFMLVAFSSPVKFSKSVFSGVKFRAKFEVVRQKQFLSIDRCESLEIRLLYRKLSSR